MLPIPMKSLTSLVTMDRTIQLSRIKDDFIFLHDKSKSQFPNWTYSGTSKKMASKFWMQDVISHFGMILLIALIPISFFTSHTHFMLAPIFMGGLVSFLGILLFTYMPIYYSEFLPKLDLVISEQEMLFSAGENKMKCKRTQYSSATLTLIFYTFLKTSHISLPPCNDQTAELLNRMFGTDKDKLKQNLSRLYKPSSLTIREKAELIKGINTAEAFFEKLNISEAIQILHDLELKIQRVCV